MAYITADRVKETTNSTGTGAITLAGASKACQAFSAVMSIGDTCSYAIVSVSGSEWETGIATYSAANTLTRTTVNASSNGGALVDFPAGSKDVFLGPTASAVLDRNASVYELGSAKSDDAYVVITPPLPESHTREGASLYLLAGLSNSDGYNPVKAGDLILSGGTQYGGIRTRDNEGRVIIQGNGGNLLEWRDGESVRGYIDYNGSFSLNPYDTSAGSTNEIRFVELASNGTNYVGFKAPDSIASNRIWTLPSGDGSANQGLITNGSGVLSWATNTGTGSNVLSNAPTLTTATFAAGTISTSTPNTITQTWNNAAVTFSGLTMNVTDSASTAASYLVDLQVGGVSQVQIEKTGIINFWHNGGAKKLLGLTSATGSAATGIYAYGSSGTAWGFFAAGAFGFGLSGNGGTITTSGFLGWGSTPNDGNPDLRFYRDAADTLAQRRTTNAQAFRIYNTYTDASNYERAEMGWTGNVFNIGIANAGTGSVRRLGIGSGTNVPININSTMEFQSASRTLSWYTGDYFGLNNSELVLGTSASPSNSSVGVRNSTAPQNFRVYNTFTNSTNYERLGISWASDICTIGLQQAGTGLVRSLVIAGANATSGAGGNVTITAGNGSGVGAGGNIILQPGAQGSSGGNGVIRINSETGSNFATLKIISSYQCTLQFGGSGNMFTFGSNSGIGQIRFGGAGSSGGLDFNGDGSPFVGTADNATESSRFAVGTSSATTAVVFRRTAGTGLIQAWRAAAGTNVMGVGRDGELFFSPSTTAFSANTNDLALTGSGFQRINCTSAASLTGIAPPSGGTHVDGRMVRVYNVGTANLTLAHNSASSAAANRMFSSTGADIILAPNDYAELIYDITSNGSGAAGWRMS